MLSPTSTQTLPQPLSQCRAELRPTLLLPWLWGFAFCCLLKIELSEDGMLGAAEEAGRSMPHRRVVSLCASGEWFFSSPPLGCQTCISEVLMRPSALASSGVSPLFSVLLTRWPWIPKAGKTKQRKCKQLETIITQDFPLKKTPCYHASWVKSKVPMYSGPWVQKYWVLSYAKSMGASSTQRLQRVWQKDICHSHLDF